MNHRHRPVVTSTLTRFAVGGAAGIAALLAAAPGAIAATADDIAPDATTEATTSPETAPAQTPEATVPAPPAVAPVAPTTDAPSTQPAAKADIEPDFGAQKFRIGVQVADGSWVPGGTTTAGSTFTITETGPNVDGDNGTNTRTFTCTTAARPTGDDPGSDDPGADPATFCDGGDGGGQPSVMRSSAAKAAAAPATGGVTVDPNTSGNQVDGRIYTAQPGSTVTITQATAAANLVKTTAVATIPPCERSEVDYYCAGSYSIFDERLSTVRFINTGLPPKAADDSARTRVDTPVAIDVLTNDDTVNGAPLTGIEPVTAPSNGTVTVDGRTGVQAGVQTAATGPAVTYTPRKGFTGQETFTYEISTANGTATATVTVTVAADATPTRDTPVTDEPGTDDGVKNDDDGVKDDGDQVLPDAGGFDASYLYAGVGLLTVGGALTVAAGRRQRRADDV